MTFRENLRPYQYIHALSLNIFQHFLPGILSARTVAIDAHDSGMGKPTGQSGFHPLRAVAERGNILIAAFGAIGWKALLMSTMVAAQFLFAQVYDQATGAALAGRRPSA